MITVKVVTSVRGFLKDLFDSEFSDISISYSQGGLYETNSKLKEMGSKLIKNKLFNHLGIFNIVEADVQEAVALSYNRFLHTNKPYILLLENPLAPLHYAYGRNSTAVSKVKLNKVFTDKNLKAIVCLSDACRDTIRNYYDTKNKKIVAIRPLVRTRFEVSETAIKEKAHSDVLQLLYVSSRFELKGGQDILSAFTSIENEKLKLKIICKRETIPEKDWEIISDHPRIQFHEFNLSKDELAKEYNSSNILLNPTRQDSFSLVVLEAMKYGNAILSSFLYAIPEMVAEGEEGYLTNPKYLIWNENNMPNPYVWTHRDKTIYSSYVDHNMVDFLVEKIVYLMNNRDVLQRMELAAFRKANTDEFSEKGIIRRWEEVFRGAMKE